MSAIKAAGAAFTEYLERARSIVPIIEGEADEAERSRGMTPAVIDALRGAGLFWMLVPCAQGGGGLRFDEWLAVIEEISCADGATGWALMTSTVATGNLATLYDDAHELYAQTPMPVGCATVAPVATGTMVDGGVRVAGGPISFNSGFDAATYVGVMARMVDGRETPVMAGPDMPEMRLCFLEKDRVENRGNWDVMGMAASGSYDVWVPEQVVPEGRTRRLAELVAPPGEPWVGDTIDVASSGVVGHAGVALGIMRRALQEAASATVGRSRLGYPGPVDQHPSFLHDFARQEANYQAARGYVLAVMRDTLEAVESRGELSVLEMNRVRQVTTWVHDVATEVVSSCSLWGGSRTFRNPSALGRCVRDIMTARNHALVDPITLINAAPSLVAEWSVRR